MHFLTLAEHQRKWKMVLCISSVLFLFFFLEDFLDSFTFRSMGILYVIKMCCILENCPLI